MVEWYLSQSHTLLNCTFLCKARNVFPLSEGNSHNTVIWVMLHRAIIWKVLFLKSSKLVISSNYRNNSDLIKTIGTINSRIWMWSDVNVHFCRISSADANRRKIQSNFRVGLFFLSSVVLSIFVSMVFQWKFLVCLALQGGLRI